MTSIVMGFVTMWLGELVSVRLEGKEIEGVGMSTRVFFKYLWAVIWEWDVCLQRHK
jgi:hypothetical protein